jgi:hypothetical protein
MRCTSWERSGPTFVPSLRKRYLEGHRLKNQTFSDDCIIYRKILNINDVEKLQTGLDRLGD